MKAIKLMICLLCILSSGLALANPTGNSIYQDITTVSNINHSDYPTFVSGGSLLVDGDFSRSGGFGSLDQMTTTIKTDNPNATGNLHAEVFFTQKGSDCSAKAPLVFPLKVVDNKIVLPTGIYIIKDKISYSNERCISSLNVKYFEIKIEKPDSRYVIYAAAGHR